MANLKEKKKQKTYLDVVLNLYNVFLLLIQIKLEVLVNKMVVRIDLRDPGSMPPYSCINLNFCQSRYRVGSGWAAGLKTFNPIRTQLGVQAGPGWTTGS